MKPFLKWAGGKYRVLKHIEKALPKGKRLVEPFVGSGAVFLNTSFASYLLSDTNADLINLYNQLKNDGPHFIKLVKKYFVLMGFADTTKKVSLTFHMAVIKLLIFQKSK